jgi:hypothetical protein
VLAHGFTENRQFGAKTNWSSVFLGCDPHIGDRLYISAPYMSFYGFWKKFKFSLKIHMCYPTVLAKITSLWWKLTKTPYFLVVTHIRDRLYITMSYICFYGYWNFLNFHSKFIGVLSYGFTENLKFGAKTNPNFTFQGHDPHIPDRLYITVLHMSFYRF